MPKNIVYFLGAGASKSFGYPVTSSIMPEIIKLLRQKDLFQIGTKKTALERKQEKDLLRYLELLYPGLRSLNADKDWKKIPSITEVLSLIDYFCYNAVPAHCELTVEKLLYLRDLVNRSLGELLLKYDDADYTQKEYALLKRFMKPLKQEKMNDRVSVITTNYDLIIDNEFSAEMHDNRVDYGIKYRNVYTNELMAQPIRPLFHYYKLHGSLNWIKCGLCGQYYIHPEGSIIHNAFTEKLSDANTCICSDHLKLASVLVAPSFVRDVRDVNLLHIWKAAQEAVRTADKLIMIGYSLPPEDLGIKSIFIRALNGRDKRKSLAVDVVQLGNDAKPYYHNIFSNHQLSYHNKGLEAYLRASDTQLAVV